MPGRGMGERLAIDPNMNRVLYLGTRSGNGLYKSSDYGGTWSKVTSFPNPGTWRVNPSDTVGLDGDIIGIVWVTFDTTSGTPGNGSKRIFVGVAEKGADTIYVTEDGGSTCKLIPSVKLYYTPDAYISKGLSSLVNLLDISHTVAFSPLRKRCCT